MGLCKCPKKKVTNQFCFEHRVNVCEHCMVTNHSKCVVQSYLQWLQDSDYNPNCSICKTELAEGDCIRLTCYHVFHWDCLNKYAVSLSPQTRPEEYVCPICNVSIFPQPNAVSPVADALRNVLMGVNWARAGLGYPALESSLLDENPHSNSMQFSSLRTPNDLPLESPKKPAPINISNSANHPSIDSVRPEPYGAAYTGYTNARKVYDSTEHGHYRPPQTDHDEDKYKRRSLFERLNRWFKSQSHTGKHRKRDPSIIYKRWMIIIVLGLIALCTLCILFLKWGRANADSDPLLDPHYNPNIRVEDIAIESHSVAAEVEKLKKVNIKELLPA
ncbi:zinc finger protein-like 1 homolog [Parasteatoda tepidariorum]|uniref:Zinc finger protein-like 1 homolog n=1 Tax=Parasteatoda tepidariorum TaxID=114398 RepID=A0A2L2YII1_PARTP|nr:zinc finger protein-like 1 homolog [Parasteatoda tepidariorum]